MLTSVIIFTSGILVALHEGSVLTVVGLVGEIVILPCKYNVKTHGISNVCWGRDQSWFSCEYTLITSDGMRVNFRESNRYDLSSVLYRGDVSLTIKEAQKSDSGFYICRIEIPGMFNDLSHTVHLIITNGINPINATTDAKSPTTLEKPSQEENQIKVITDMPSTPSEMSTQDLTDDSVCDSVAQVTHTEDTMETFIVTAVRVGAVIFAPGLIIALVRKLKCPREQTASNGMENVPLQHHSNSANPLRPVETLHVETHNV